MGASETTATPVAPIAVCTDTIPLEDRSGDFTTDQDYNPFSLEPSIIERNVEYDPETGYFIIDEKIGDQYYRTPSYMTLSEYLDWQEEKQRREDINKWRGVNPVENIKADFFIDPVSELDIEALLTERLFGGEDFNIKPRGSIGMNLGVRATFNEEGPNIDSTNATIIQVDEVLQQFDVGLDGNIGEKMNIGFNFNQAAAFNVDNQLKLGYLADAFDEDGIIKNIEAGDVTFPLNSQLIQGRNDMFGLKTELQFGHLFLTGAMSITQTSSQNLRLQNGNVEQEFRIRPDEYDENRHFLISHFNRENFNNAMSDLPVIKSNMRVTNIEVWVSTLPNENLRNVRTVVALADLGESDVNNLVQADNPNIMLTPQQQALEGNGELFLPQNDNSTLFGQLIDDDEARSYDRTASVLQSQYGLQVGTDFDIARMRKLSPSEFSFNPQLGMISLNIRLQPNQVLAVSYEYTYSVLDDKIYKVGEITNETNVTNEDSLGMAEPSNVIYTKMLKPVNQTTSHPTWDLMMKNVYSVGTGRLNQEGFEFDIFFEDNNTGTRRRYIPSERIEGLPDPLLDIFKLDRLNSQMDPQPDGIFDFIPGATVNLNTSSIIFPVLEPFGSSLENYFDNRNAPGDFEEYGFPELYDTLKILARELVHKNRFIMTGRVQSGSSDIFLGFNIPRGSVIVRAGSQILIEGVDYVIDYGTGRLKVINDVYLQQGVPIDVSFENEQIANFGNQRTMFGLRAEYREHENLTFGATLMHMRERPATQKVNIQGDPFSNTIYGLDVNWTSEAPVVTDLLNKLPFYSTNETSSVTFSAEFAALRPSNHGAINVPPNGNEPVVSLDDFEGANGQISLATSTNDWVLSSTPLLGNGDINSNQSVDRYGAENINQLSYNNRRALLSWNVLTDFNIRQNQQNRQNSYTRLVREFDLFPERRNQADVTDLQILNTMDIHYFPSLRGPYNFNTEGVTCEDGEIRLPNPRNNFGGMMRFLNTNNDFETSNVEYIEFWLLNPFMERPDGLQGPGEGEGGTIYFHLGSMSEDILADDLQFYENAVPTEGNNVPTQTTVWGDVPLRIPNVNAFRRDDSDALDVGLDGMTDAEERVHYAEYIATLEAQGQQCNLTDPANDNFVSYLDEEASQFGEDLLSRLRKFNNPEGNSGNGGARLGAGRATPDTEDLNGNRSLDNTEAFYEYRLRIENRNGEIDTRDNPFITDIIEASNAPNGVTEKWYRVRIPIRDIESNSSDVVGDIEGFRSIQFMRMFLGSFEQPVTLRLAEFQLVRNQWRRIADLDGDGESDCEEEITSGNNFSQRFIVDEVGLFENGRRTPINYVRPPGVNQELFAGTVGALQQDETSISIRTQQGDDIPPSCHASIYKIFDHDLRLYDTLQMFVHAESLDSDRDLDLDTTLSVYMRFGRDMINHYYEYEIPLTLSRRDVIERLDRSIAADFLEYVAEVWREENMFNVPLKEFTDIKIARNIAGVGVQDTFGMVAPGNPSARIRIKGNPSLGEVRTLVIGVRNNSEDPKQVEVWVNELRLKGLKNEGGVAGLARMDIQMADLGNLTIGGDFATSRFGQVDQRLQERPLHSTQSYDIATNLQLNKFLPEKWNLQIPFYYQYSRTEEQDVYDPFEHDLTVDTLRTVRDENPDRVEDLRLYDLDERSKRTTTIRTVNFTNVRKQRSPDAAGKKPKPWDIENVSVSYSNTKTTNTSAIYKAETIKEERGELNYTYNTQGATIQPFKNLNAKSLRFLKELNFNPLPNSFTFNTELQRWNSRRIFRLPDPERDNLTYAFDDVRFNWTRNYALRWDLAKSLKLTYSATARSVIDEYRQSGLAETLEGREWFNERGESVDTLVRDNPDLPREYRGENFRELGRMKFYDQNLNVNYTVPFKYIPILNWVDARFNYTGGYTWEAGSLVLARVDPDNPDPWNTIQNKQSIGITTNFDFEKLYDKVDYLKQLQGNRRGRRSRSRDGGSSREVGTVERIFLQPLLALKSIKVSWREDRNTVIPGFLPEPNLLGVGNGAPGYDFVFGVQPNIDINSSNNWLVRAANNGWITQSNLQNQQVLQNTRQSFQARIELEPWKDLKIDVDFKKNYTRNHAEDFVYRDDMNGEGFFQTALRDFGNYEISYFNLGTLFGKDSDVLFQTFQSNREVIAQRLPNVDNPGAHDISAGYPQGYGPEHVDVSIPAFLAAYKGDDPSNVQLFLTDDVGRNAFIPLPNWRLQFSGLSKLEMFRDIFANINISHGYSSTLSVGSYTTDLQYDPQDPFNIGEEQSNGNYYARFEIPNISIDERFEPIIGIDVRTVGGVSAKAEYSKSRRLEFITGAARIEEEKRTQFTFGMGWVGEDVHIGLFKGKRKRGRDKAEPTPDPLLQDDDEKPKEKPRFKPRLAMNLDMAVSDNLSLKHTINEGNAEVGTETYTLQISPTIDYDLNEYFTLGFYFDMRQNRSALANQISSTIVRTGLRATFNLR